MKTAPEPGHHPGRGGVISVQLDVALLAEELASAILAALEDKLDSNRSPWLDLEAAAEYLSCPRERVRKLVQRREVPFHQQRAGGRIFFNRRELDQWMLSQ